MQDSEYNIRALLSDLPDALKNLPVFVGSIFSGKHQARYVKSDVSYHVITRAFQGRCLLTPTPKLNSIIAGVIGRAQKLYPNVRLYAYAFLSNHAHLLMQAPPDEFVGFIGFVKREISRRHGQAINWHDAMWSQYVYAALPSPASQIACFKYVLSQGVKEGLVRRAEEWPGVHVAKQFVGTNPQALSGTWFDGTAAAINRARERYKAKRRAAKAKASKPDKKATRPKRCDAKKLKMDPRSFEATYTVEVTQLPPWAELSAADYRAQVAQLCDEVAKEAYVARKGKPVLGKRAILSTPIDTAFDLVVPPWLEGRKSLICWVGLDNGETEKYIEEYWEQQRWFRAASDAYLAGDLTAAFPPWAFRPVVSEIRLRQLRRSRAERGAMAEAAPN